MQGYDATLKLLLQSQSNSAVRQLFGGAEVKQWLNAELPQVWTPRADLLGSTANGQLIHIELQSGNDDDMVLRMAEYALAIYRSLRRFPRQLVLYVGEPEMRMEDSLASEGGGLRFQCRMFDVRELDGEMLLQSSAIEDNLLAILTRWSNQVAVLREILARIADLKDPRRAQALTQLLIISGLRRLGPTIKEEVRKMPILDDLLSHEVIGPAILQGRLEGREEGRLEGRLEGRQEGVQQEARKLLHTLIEKRFGSAPRWAEERMAHLPTSELEELATRLFDASSLEELFSNPK